MLLSVVPVRVGSVVPVVVGQQQAGINPESPDSVPSQDIKEPGLSWHGLRLAEW